jgi:ubiquinone/menaquinone biosynthesis C-methylase UbiE
MDQEKVWEKIAPKWNELKNTPFLAVEKFLKKKKGKILDLGSGSGRNFPYFPKGSEIYAVDFSAKMLKYADEKAKKYGFDIETVKADTTNLPLEDNFFDHGICIAVLHCIETDEKRQKTLEEFYRVLKPGAKGLLSVWGRNSLRVKNKPKETYVPWTSVGIKKRYTYLYDRGELEKDLKNVGFEVIRSFEKKNINVIVRKPTSS